MECTPGEQKCIGFHSYICTREGVWAILEYNAPECQGLPPPPLECTPGEQKCIGVNSYICTGEGKWAFLESNAPQCQPPPLPPPPEEEYKGKISNKQLEYDESRASIPVYDIPQDKRGLVHIWGRNDMSTSEKLGIYWFIADPEGRIVEEYTDWEWGTTGPGREHEFIGGRFDLDREKYTMWVRLLMNPNNPETVDRYIGDLCTVVTLEYKGSIAKKELEYNGDRKPIPVH